MSKSGQITKRQKSSSKRQAANSAKSSPRLPVTPSPPPSPGLPVTTSPRPSLITLLTDFGLSDYFVGAMKGAIFDINSSVRVVDITHDIPPQAIDAAAFNLLAVYKTFGAGTIHVAVVDPGVGSARRAIVISAGGQFFVGPDNGIFSYVLERESEAHVHHVTNDEYFRKPTSATFHGRDVFAPIAAALSTGVSPRELGDEINDPVRLKSLAPERLKHGRLGGRLIHIDRFGNCITNFTQADLPAELIRQGARLSINGKVVSEFREFFADESKARLFAIWGSAGFLEIVAPNRSAAKSLRAKRGDKVLLEAPPVA